MRKNFTINELCENRNRAWEQAKAFLDGHRTENGTLSPEDAAAYERMEADVVNLGREIERMERARQIDEELTRPVGTPLTNTPGRGLDQKTGRASDAYKGAMLKALRSNFRTVSNVLVEGTDASGGYLVPTEWDSRLIEAMEHENVIRALGTVITTSGERKINVAKPAASWVEEGGELVFTDPSFNQVILDAYKLSVATKVSEELLADNQYDLEGFLIRAFGASIAAAEEEAFITGDGSSKPTASCIPPRAGRSAS